MFHVKLKGGGKLPKELMGSFTSQHVAQAKIDTYVEGRKNGESRSKSSKA